MTRCRRPCGQAFSILELLAVIAVIAVLAAITLPAVSSVLRAQALQTSTALLNDQIVLARQFAQSRNSPVEVRLWSVGPKDQAASGPAAFRAIQLFSVDSGNSAAAGPLGPVRWLEDGVVLRSNADARLTNLLLAPESAGVQQGSNSGEARVPNLPANATHISFLCRPGGTTSLSPDAGSYFLTVAQEHAGGSGADVPSNYRVVVIDPVNTRTRILAP